MSCIRYGFDNLKLEKITARAEPGNIASWKILEFCSMNFIGLDEVDGYKVKIYEILNNYQKFAR